MARCRGRHEQVSRVDRRRRRVRLHARIKSVHKRDPERAVDFNRAFRCDPDDVRIGRRRRPAQFAGVQRVDHEQVAGLHRLRDEPSRGQGNLGRKGRDCLARCGRCPVQFLLGLRMAQLDRRHRRRRRRVGLHSQRRRLLWRSCRIRDRDEPLAVGFLAKNPRRTIAIMQPIAGA